jgi:opacity protein-like surface antigen
LLSCSCLLSVSAQAAEKGEAGTEPQAEFSALAGLAVRSASTDPAINPDGIGYDPAPQFSFQGRGYVWSWLNAAIYYRRASHELNLPRGAAGFDYEHIEKDKILTYSLGARLEPTYHVSDEFRTWLSLGVGWGRMTLDKVDVTEAERSFTVPDRAGVFVEVPIGIGASYEVVPNWFAVHAEIDIAPLSKQSGKLFDPTPFVDSHGSLSHAGPMPTQTVSGSFLLGVSLLL